MNTELIEQNVHRLLGAMTGAATTAMVAVGEQLWPDPALPAEESLELMQADYAAGAAEAEVAVLTPGLRLTPGSEGELQVRVTSGLASELRGEAQLVSPFGSWEMLEPWTQGFSVAPGASVGVVVVVRREEKRSPMSCARFSALPLRT